MKLNQKQLLNHCLKKRKYQTLDEANLAGLRILKQTRKCEKMFIYLCNNGKNHFHLTKQKTKHKVI